MAVLASGRADRRGCFEAGVCCCRRRHPQRAPDAGGSRPFADLRRRTIWRRNMPDRLAPNHMAPNGRGLFAETSISRWSGSYARGMTGAGQRAGRRPRPVPTLRRRTITSGESTRSPYGRRIGRYPVASTPFETHPSRCCCRGSEPRSPAISAGSPHGAADSHRRRRARRPRSRRPAVAPRTGRAHRPQPGDDHSGAGPAGADGRVRRERDRATGASCTCIARGRAARLVGARPAGRDGLPGTAPRAGGGGARWLLAVLLAAEADE